MKDQQKQAMKAFEADYKDNHFTMRLDQTQSLLISVENLLTLDTFGLKLDEAFILEQKELKYFDKPIEIFDYLIHHFERVTLQDGLIKFDYVLGNMWKNVKSISIKLVKQETDPMKLKMKKMKEEFTVELKKKLVRIEELEILLKKNQEENEQLKSTNKELIGALEELEQKNVELKEKMKKSSQKPSPIKKQKIQVEVIQRAIELSNLINHHPKNAHLMYYNITKSQGCSNIKSTGDGYYNFVNSTEVLPGETAKYTIKIIKAKINNIMIGFCTERGFGNVNNFSNNESVYYWCIGRMYIGGVEKQINLPSTIGEYVTCVVDLVKNHVEWRKNDTTIFESELPVTMEKKSLYLSVILRNINDEFDLYA